MNYRLHSVSGLVAALCVPIIKLLVISTAGVAQATNIVQSEGERRGVLDESTVSLGPAFAGLDPAALISGIDAAYNPKPASQIEAATANLWKRSGLSSRAEIPAVPTSGRLAFLLNAPDVPKDGLDGDVSIYYDAKLQIMSIGINIVKRHIILDQEIADVFVLRSAIVNSRDYIGTNAFGASVNATSILSETLGLIFDDGTWLTPTLRPVSLPLEVGPSDATDLANRLGVLLLCTATPPWIRTGMRSSSATFDDPTGVTDIGRYLHVAPDAIWIFDRPTGKVLFKFDEGSLSVQRLKIETARHARFPLNLVIRGGWSAFISYQVDDLPEQSGVYAPGYGRNIVQLPLVIDAKRQIIVRVGSKENYEYYSRNLTFWLNGQAMKPKWHVDKASRGGFSDAYVILSYP
jgi:hypothetical protein